MKQTGWVLLALWLVSTGCASPTNPGFGPLVSNPWNGNPNTGYQIASYGFYIQSYPGSSLSSVEIWLLVTVTGSYSYSMTASDQAFGGPVIGTASSGAVTLTNNSVYYPVTFTFNGNPSVTKTHTLVFTVNQISGPGVSNYCSQNSNSGNASVVLTSGFTPPLGNPTSTGIALIAAGNG